MVQMMNVQLRAIITAALKAVTGDKKNLKTPEQKQFSGWVEDIANFLQISYKNVIYGSKFSQPHIPQQQRKSFMPYPWWPQALPKFEKMPSSINEKNRQTFAQATIGHNSKLC